MGADGACTVRILYFASIREAAGVGEEDVALAGAESAVGDLIGWIAARGGAQAAALADLGRVRIAVNQELATLATPLAPGDEVAFFPPMTGG